MATERSPVESAAPSPAMPSCRRNKGESGTFVGRLRDHVHDFIHASVDERKTCFQNTIKKIFMMSKAVAERSSETKQVESALPLQTTVVE